MSCQGYWRQRKGWFIPSKFVLCKESTSENISHHIHLLPFLSCLQKSSWTPQGRASLPKILSSPEGMRSPQQFLCVSGLSNTKSSWFFFFKRYYRCAIEWYCSTFLAAGWLPEPANGPWALHRDRNHTCPHSWQVFPTPEQRVPQGSIQALCCPGVACRHHHCPRGGCLEPGLSDVYTLASRRSAGKIWRTSWLNHDCPQYNLTAPR